VALTSAKGEIKELVTVRWYMGGSSSASTVYCCLWVHGKEYWISGKGQAGGYGYHKSSAALQDAITSAGINLVGNPYKGTEKSFEETERYYENDELKYRRVTVKQDFTKSCNIGGCGDTASEDAVKAICEALGYKKIYICKG
jgi:hypothetical protein